MRPEPSPFWKSKRVSRRDTFMLYHQYPELRNLLLLLDDRPIRSPSDELVIFHEQFNSLSEDQRAMVYEWAMQKAQLRQQEKIMREQLKAQMLPALIQQELQAEQEVIITKKKEEFMKKHGLIQPQDQQFPSEMQQPFMGNQQPADTMIPPSNPEIDHTQSPSKLARLRQRFRQWRERRRQKKIARKQQQMMNQMIAQEQRQQQQQSPSNTAKSRKRNAEVPIIITK